MNGSRTIKPSELLYTFRVSHTNTYMYATCFLTHSHFSEFGEIDPDKVKAAVKRFTVSCAGYSVATYILVS